VGIANLQLITTITRLLFAILLFYCISQAIVVGRSWLSLFTDTEIKLWEICEEMICPIVFLRVVPLNTSYLSSLSRDFQAVEELELSTFRERESTREINKWPGKSKQHSSSIIFTLLTASVNIAP
jgi:hypothetical protein